MALVDQAELAREAGVRKQVIVDFENGRTLPRDETIQLIQACLESLGYGSRHARTDPSGCS
jgi:DNA-binding XRE family transcriptional regulator